jgi:hypothetical protein
MTMMVAEVYKALLAAGAPEEKTVKAAQALASYDSRFNKVDADLNKLGADIKLLQWMLGLVIAGIVALITKTFF